MKRKLFWDCETAREVIELVEFYFNLTVGAPSTVPPHMKEYSGFLEKFHRHPALQAQIVNDFLSKYYSVESEKLMEKMFEEDVLTGKDTRMEDLPWRLYKDHVYSSFLKGFFNRTNCGSRFDEIFLSEFTRAFFRVKLGSGAFDLMSKAKLEGARGKPEKG